MRIGVFPLKSSLIKKEKRKKMNLEFQKDVLKFLVQRKDAKKYISVLEEDFFDLDLDRTVFSLLKGFVKKYGSQPSLGNLLQFFEDELTATPMPQSELDTIKQEVSKAIESCFEELKANVEQIRETVLRQYQIKLTKELFIQNAPKLKKGDAEVIDKIFKKVVDIKKIGDTDLEENSNAAPFALKEFKAGSDVAIEGNPTYLKGLNRLTSTNGFFSPQLVVFMAAPKGFKTGVLLNIAMNYVRDGYNVFYVDNENGERRILARFYQAMLEATNEELKSGELDDILAEMVKRFQAMGGDFKAHHFPAQASTVNDVEAELEYLRDEYNWKPDIIIWDYLDLMRPIDYRIKEDYLKIQSVYFDAIRLHKRWGLFGITVSQIHRDAVNKPVIDMTAFARDFGKAANAHAAFGLCRTEEERDAGVMRICPVIQRDGVAASSKRACFVEVDESRMKVAEITRDEWKERVDAVTTKSDKPIRKKRVRRTKNLKDE